MQVENLRVDCQALRPQPGSFSQLLGLFAASANLRSLHVTGCEEVAIAAALPMLPSFANLEVLRFEEVDGFCDHGFTLQVAVAPSYSLNVLPCLQICHNSVSCLAFWYHVFWDRSSCVFCHCLPSEYTSCLLQPSPIP